MALIKTQNNRNILLLAIVTTVASVVFSVMGAPFLRTFATTTKSIFFWLTALLLIGFLFIAGFENYKLSETAVYVGAIWMTLGAYNEFEKRGVNWKVGSTFSLASGLLVAFAGYFLILKNLPNNDTLTNLVEPLMLVMNKSFPEAPVTSEILTNYIPGMIAASLVAALALGFIFETSVSKMFNLKREKVASGLRWLEFRLPDTMIWITLFSALFAMDILKIPLVKIISVNWLIFAMVAFFFQGMATSEFLMRFYRLGVFSKTLFYILIAMQLAPFIVFMGFVDYWFDFRKRVRKKIKTN